MNKVYILLLCFIGSLFLMKCTDVDANSDIMIIDTTSVKVINVTPVDIYNWVVDYDDVWNEVVNNSWMHVGTPYEWGGDDWTGIDCSHFTQLIWNEGRDIYPVYMQTEQLKSITKIKHGLKPINLKDATAGDLLVYGKESFFQKWRGHVVMLVAKKEGIVVGSHGSIGVQFIKFAGYPEAYQGYTLKKVLRVMR